MVPFVQLNTRGQGNLRVCCTITGLSYGIPRRGTIDDVNACRQESLGAPFDLRADPISEVWNSEFMKDFRMKMIKGEYVPNCERCFLLEDRGINSKRINRNERFQSSHAHVVEEAKCNEGRISTPPVWWELRFSTKCNLSCRMCSSTLSTKRLAELQSHRQQLTEDLRGEVEMAEKLLAGGHLGDSELFRRQIDEYMKDARYLELRGGEVFADPEAVRFLRELAIERKTAANMRLDLTTNIASLTDSHIEILNGFQRGTIKCSIDAYGAENEYIRYPSRWPTIVENLKKLKNLHRRWVRVVQMTVSAYQVCTMDKLLWFIEDFVNENEIDLSLSLTTVRETLHLEPHLIPLEMRRKAIPALEDFLQRSALCNRSTHKDINRKMVLGLIKCLEDPRQASVSAVSAFVQATRALDTIRGEDVLRVFPHLGGLFNAPQAEPPFRPTQESV